MDPAKVEFLFGRVPVGLDPDDVDDRSQLLSRHDAGRGVGPALHTAAREAVASQIAADDPPIVWQTANRLLELGMDRAKILDDLARVCLVHLRDVLLHQRRFDVNGYAASLAHLPLPEPEEVEALMLDIVRDRGPMRIDELEDIVREQIGLAEEDDLFDFVCDDVGELISLIGGPLGFLPDDRVVETAPLLDGLTLTHRLTMEECAGGWLSAEPDLAGTLLLPSVPATVGGQELWLNFSADGEEWWSGTGQPLEGFTPGSVVVFRVDGGRATVEELSGEPPLPDPSLVAAVRRAYEAEVAEAALPASLARVMLVCLEQDREAFAAPRSPFGDLCETAGLEIRGDRAAHEPQLWMNESLLDRDGRLSRLLDRPADAEAAQRVLDRFDEGPTDPFSSAAVLEDLREPEVTDAVLGELLSDEDPAGLAAFALFADGLVEAARRPSQVAVAQFLAAVAAERNLDPRAGLEHLRAAVRADPGWEPAVDRLAWYLSDLGDAAGAIRTWRTIGATEEEEADLEVLLPHLGHSGPKMGRNEACWCGSGRKYKVCHLRIPGTAPLPERIDWLIRKSLWYLERRGGGVRHDVTAVAVRRAGGDERRLDRAMDDPLVLDVVLHELGWFDRFLLERGPLLPDDEFLLASAWSLAERTVFEVESCDSGAGVRVIDLRTGEHIDVTERTFSRQAGPGMLVCGRIVPTGEGNIFIGGLFPVVPGTEVRLLDILEEGSAADLLGYVVDMERPPTMVTREHEPLVTCRATVRVPDARSAAKRLDALYRREESGRWVELHELDENESILRAVITMEGTTIEVATSSEPRLDRVLAALRDAIGGAEITFEEREPFDPASMPLPTTFRDPRASAEDAHADAEIPADAEVQDVLRAVIERREEAWCDEEVPALGGLTPREAAADPVGREALDRLIASFELRGEGGLRPGGAATMRPARLRELLGL